MAAGWFKYASKKIPGTCEFGKQFRVAIKLKRQKQERPHILYKHSWILSLESVFYTSRGDYSTWNSSWSYPNQELIVILHVLELPPLDATKNLLPLVNLRCAMFELRNTVFSQCLSCVTQLFHKNLVFGEHGPQHRLLNDFANWTYWKGASLVS
jgi:hypothetical protein